MATDPTNSGAAAWSNVPAQPIAKSSAGVCGMHGLFVGPACPKCVTQPKVKP